MTRKPIVSDASISGADKAVSWREVCLAFWKEKRYDWLRFYGLIVLLGTVVVIPFVIISSTLPYAGARPPEAPLIKARGQLRIRDERVGWKTIRRFEFITEAKTVYRVSERQTSVKLYRLFQRNLPNLYVEGFVLRDGHGYFFPTQAVSEAEGVLVDEKGQYESLNVGADVVWKLVFDWMWISFPLIVIFVWKFFKIRSFIKIGR